MDELRRSSHDTDDHVVSVGAEDHKELTYPDILIQILRTFLREFSEKLQSPQRWSGRWFGQIAKRVRHPLIAANTEQERANLVAEVTTLARVLDDLLPQSEELDATYSTKESRAHAATDRIDATVSAGGAAIGGGTQVATSAKEGVERTLSQRERKRVKVERQLPDFKHILTRVSRFLGGRIFLCVDDFYYIRKPDQPPVADYIHRICKDTQAFLKVATIRHRSELYRHGDVTRGVVFGHEVQKIDLDLPLGQFDTVEHFLQGIWEEVCRETKTDQNGVFKGEGFAHAVLASGGVPRDFFGVIKYAANLAGTRGEVAIGKLRVSEAARRYTEDTKFPELFEGSGQDSLLELLIADITRFARDLHRRNCFHIDLDELDRNPEMRSIVEALVDGRLIHLISDNTTNARRSGRYAAYLLDVGLYAHPQRRGRRAIEEVKFWETDPAGRLKNLERSPVYPLRGLKQLEEARRRQSTELGSYLFPPSDAASQEDMQMDFSGSLLPLMPEDGEE
ncbi:MAG: hypothetical protein OXI76_04840 [Gemmatimonadota bacterium]|nr:hypothetical protein [Gemmatimonadota bacterium]